ncbi:glycoside hydrolase family 15 protein [Streptomyces bambusae]|uniref:glycoside hydrolase family 15 protein n=1 Tax=Streptomyces bambusae TaxID=1550616 RepID=UPI001CFE353A|nr:glycoside hydrolase family 15 protein [Streptomyces bambusae]MCB5167760.1 glycoside hydrolase family 15 protein [Streptomyces bambusae]
MERYPLIADHGLVGDLQTAALVSNRGVVDWFAAPRFDSPGIFSGLLDHERGGWFRLAVDGTDVTVKQLYYPDTAVLVTRFMSPDGVGELLDWMPPDRTGRPAARHSLMRVVRCTRGTVRFTLDCRPRFDFGRAPHTLRIDGRTAEFRAPGTSGFLQTNIPLERHGEADVRGEIVLTRGERAGAAFTADEAGASAPDLPAGTGVEADFWATVDYWQKWVGTTSYRGRWPDMVHRSAITLKLLTYLPTGAPIAAATLGLPEQVGGERNWDYRYTWIRDGSLSVRALLDLGFVEEATAFTDWLTDRVTERGPRVREGAHPLQIMYRVDGDPQLPEEVLDHFEGYRGSYPVRVGNAAADQVQLDIYGESLYALAQGQGRDAQPTYAGWQAVSSMLDWLTGAWDRPDEGIWETRGGPKEFTYSRVMSWVAFDRGLRLAEEFGRPAAPDDWRRARDEIFAQVMERGWSRDRGAFVQHYGTGVLDASLLLIPRVGLLSPTDPLWLSTLDAIDRELVEDSLVFRYDPQASPDGLRGAEGTFSLCTFLYVDALARAGRVRQARFSFEKMLTYANHVGLFSEEIGPSGEQLGNFPQAFTHLSLIMAATTLDDALDQAAARGR